MNITTSISEIMVILHSAGREAAIPELKIVGFLKNDATVMPLFPLKSITRFMDSIAV